MQSPATSPILATVSPQDDPHYVYLSRVCRKFSQREFIDALANIHRSVHWAPESAERLWLNWVVGKS